MSISEIARKQQGCKSNSAEALILVGNLNDIICVYQVCRTKIAYKFSVV